MTKKTATSLILITVVGILTVAGCDYAQFKSKRVVELSCPLAAGNAFEAATHNGRITVQGIETETCAVVAAIEGRATTEERAKQLADETSVSIEERGDGLAAVIDKPRISSHESVSVSFDIRLPDATALKLETHNGAVNITSIASGVTCSTHNGAVELTDIKGRLDASTHNGQIHAANVGPESRLVTHNGQIICEGLSGCASLKTHNGNVTASYAAGSPPACEMSAVTYNGSIDIEAPADLSAMATLSTHNGSVKTDIPITVSGDVKKNHIEGRIGTGEGKVRLETYNGSIRLR